MVMNDSELVDFITDTRLNDKRVSGYPYDIKAWIFHEKNNNKEGVWIRVKSYNKAEMSGIAELLNTSIIDPAFKAGIEVRFYQVHDSLLITILNATGTKELKKL
jgi:hypothetical protein